MLPRTKLLSKRAKKLTANATKAERTFRKRLTDQGINHTFQQVIGFYIADFLLPHKCLIIELDGSVHLKRQKYDARRTKWLESFGFKVLRIPNKNAQTFDLNTLHAYPHQRSKTTLNAIAQANKARNKFLSKRLDEIRIDFVAKTGQRAANRIQAAQIVARTVAPLTLDELLDEQMLEAMGRCD